ncbi:MAG: PfkB family carbohydrate kinase, partial [Chitinispirillaceae bacterium]|nr:PfkB family carbohydrate kinase [Chitinispirillaceae bacterium]
EKVGLQKDTIELIDYLPESGFFALRERGELIKAVNVTCTENAFLRAENYKDLLCKTPAVCLDFNNSLETIVSFLMFAKAPVYFQLVSEEKSLKILSLIKNYNNLLRRKVKGIFLNRYELKYLLNKAGVLSPLDILKSKWIVTKDKEGVSIISPKGEEDYQNLIVTSNSESFSGAGDAFAAGYIFGKEKEKLMEDTCVHIGYELVEKNIQYRHSNTMNESILEEIDNMFFRDTLTGLFTRRFFIEEAAINESRMARTKKKTSVILLDIDNFKKINDTYGHDVGDIVLKEIGKIITDSTRKQDIPVRYGGEELLVLLPETSKNQAVKIAERIRKKVKYHTIGTEDGKTPSISVTVSGGVADGLCSIEEIIKKADICLYKAKHTGKDRIVVCE